MKNKFIYALGFFDGVHLGHQALLQESRRLAEKLGCQAGAVTFSVHPEALTGENAPRLLTDLRERSDLLGQFGAKKVVVLPFDKTLMNTPWEAFLDRFSDAAGFVCGSDFRFGAKGAGTAELLKSRCQDRGLAWGIVPQQYLEGVRISSTHIRTLLAEGNVEEATRFLGHSYTLSGTVVHGQGLGRKIGIPTANMAISGELLLPKLGVYACKAFVGEQSFPAVTNIGTRPTVSGTGITLEPWLLDFAGDLYGREIKLSLLSYLRPETKFGSLEELQAEIEKNAAQTRKILENS